MHDHAAATGPVARVLADVDVGRELLTIGRAMKLPELRRNGRSPSPSSGFRWISSGAGPDKIRLDAMKTARGLVTTDAAVRRFLAALNGTEIPAATPAAVRREHARAAAECAAAGL